MRAFDSWDLQRPHVPRRSLLHPLAPIGIGTPFVESLTSYVTRLAEVHAVTVSDLVGYVLAGCAAEDSSILPEGVRHYRLGSGFRSEVHGVNGLAEEARRWIAAVETATDRTDLRFLTLRPLRQVLCKNAPLLRRAQAWCPQCLQEGRENGQAAYLPLLWNLQMVRCCPRHSRPLVDTCPHCGHGFGPLMARSCPGCCSRCRQWLGGRSRLCEDVNSPDGDSAWTPTAIGDLLASVPQLQEQHLRVILRENLAKLVRKVTGGNQHAFATLAEISEPTVSGCLSGRTVPRENLLVHMCSRLRIPISGLLRRHATWNVPGDIIAAGIAASRRFAWRDDPEKLRLALRESLTRNPPPSLTEVALSLNYRTCAPLQRLDPKCCEQITSRYRAYQRAHHSRWAVPDKRRLARIKKALIASLSSEKPTPVARIAAKFGYESVCSLNMYFPDLCRAIALKQRQIRETRREELRMAATEAMQEEPPPTVVALARRFGCCHTVLRQCFPNLCQGLQDARKDWQARARESFRMELEQLIAARRGASVEEICRSARISQGWLWMKYPDLARAIVAGNRERRIHLRDQQRAVLHDDVRRAVIELSRRGLRPNVVTVAPYLSDRAAKDWKLIYEEIQAALREPDYAAAGLEA